MEPAVRHKPDDIAEVRACLHGYPPYMKVEVRGDIPVIAKTVARPLLALHIAAGLDLELSPTLRPLPESVVVVERAS